MRGCLTPRDIGRARRAAGLGRTFGTPRIVDFAAVQEAVTVCTANGTFSAVDGTMVICGGIAGGGTFGGGTPCGWPRYGLAAATANSSTIAAIKAGKSAGLRLETKWRSTTTGMSSQRAPAFTRSS